MGEWSTMVESLSCVEIVSGRMKYWGRGGLSFWWISRETVANFLKKQEN